MPLSQATYPPIKVFVSHSLSDRLVTYQSRLSHKGFNIVSDYSSSGSMFLWLYHDVLDTLCCILDMNMPSVLTNIALVVPGCTMLHVR